MSITKLREVRFSIRILHMFQKKKAFVTVKCHDFVYIMRKHKYARTFVSRTNANIVPPTFLMFTTSPHCSPTVSCCYGKVGRVMCCVYGSKGPRQFGPILVLLHQYLDLITKLSFVINLLHKFVGITYIVPWNS